MEIYDTIILALKVTIGLTVFFVFLFVVIRPLFKSFSEEHQRFEQTPYHRTLHRDKLEEEELEIPTSQPDDLPADKIIKMAKDDPTKTTLVVRNWIHEKKHK